MMSEAPSIHMDSEQEVGHLQFLDDEVQCHSENIDIFLLELGRDDL
jgi:hypothetical protein